MVQARQQISHLVCLDGDQHHVLWPGISRVLHRAGQWGVLLSAVFQQQLEAIGLDGRQVLIAGNEGHVFTGNRQLGAQVATNGACTNDSNFHGHVLAQAKLGRQPDALQLAGGTLGDLVHE